TCPRPGPPVIRNSERGGCARLVDVTGRALIDMPTLHPNHEADLAKRGLARETIDAAGIHSESDGRKLATLLNRKRWDRKLGSALVFPFHDEVGTVVLHRVKPDNRPQRNGKPGPKYLSPVGAVVRAYIPPTVNGALADPAQALIATEGEMKSLKATQEGFPSIGLTGVDCWHNKKSTALIPDLARIEWKDRTAYIAFDSDAVDNENVQVNERLLAGVLQNHGARVKIVRLPPGPDGAKVGLDDFLVAHGHKLLAEAEDPEPVQPDEVKQPASEMLPEVEGSRFIEGTKKDGHARIVYWNDTFWLWRRGRWEESPESEIRAEVAQFVNRRYLKVGQQAVANVMGQIKAQAILTSRIEPPAWLDTVPGSDWPEIELVATNNKIVHLPSLFANKTHTVPSTPALFNTVATDFPFTDGDKCPKPDRWMRFLYEEVWADDPEAAEALQLWAGYLLTPDTSQQKLVAVVGPKRGGKGTVVRVLRALVGEQNTAAPTLSSLSQNFGLWPLIGKTLAIINDARLSGRPDAAVIVERLLSITGEDALTIDRKCLRPVTVTLPTRLMIVSNELPRLADASATIASRMIVLRTTKSWFGKEDPHLTADLMKELPGVLWWALDGWRKLRERGSLLQPESGAELLSDWQDLISPVGAFVRERCLVGPEHSISRSDLYDEFKSWCEEAGRRNVPDQAGLGRDLRAVVPTLRTTHHRVFGKLQRFHQGISLQTGGE
ncbi:MAG: phage/plasmid primase, P4 family, partial [Planctomycetota bacterium]